MVCSGGEMDIMDLRNVWKEEALVVNKGLFCPILVISTREKGLVYIIT